VFAVLCRAALPKQGTGFLHKSGRVITAGHVVSGCSGPDTLLAGDDKVKAGVSTIIRDEMMDLALEVRDIAVVDPEHQIIVADMSPKRGNLAHDPGVSPASHRNGLESARNAEHVAEGIRHCTRPCSSAQHEGSVDVEEDKPCSHVCSDTSSPSVRP